MMTTMRTNFPQGHTENMHTLKTIKPDTHTAILAQTSANLRLSPQKVYFVIVTFILHILI